MPAKEGWIFEHPVTGKRVEIVTADYCQQLEERYKYLCEIYFDIAAECVGEDEVRRRRDAKISEAR